ncbi:MAG: hypothetical protein JXA15_11575 [Spirochaetales bacterium]|nr:hypothetical protein [Spirochaetales bacterium]
MSARRFLSITLPALAVAALALLAVECAPGQGVDAPRASGGMLDLRAWDFDEGPVALAGEWEFAPGRFIDPGAAFGKGEAASSFVPREVPDRWRDGDAGSVEGRGGGTYRLSVRVRPGVGRLALRFTTIATAFEVYANGALLATGGRPSLDPAAAVAGYKPAAVELPASSDGRFDLVVRVSNHEYREGGMWRAFALGRARNLVAAKRFRDAYSLGLACGLAAMSVHAMILFLHRRKERSYLYFSLFAVLVAIRTLVTGEYVMVDIFPSLPFEAIVRIEYATAFLALPAGILFFIFLFRDEAPGLWLPFALLAPMAPFIFLLVLAPLPTLTRGIFWFYAVAWVLMVSTLAFVLLRAAIRRKPGGLVLLVAGTQLGLAAMNDMAYSSFSFPTADVIPFSLAIFILAQDFVLSRRFTRAFDESERLAVELEDSNRRLELLLAEKETHVKEIHHRVKNSLQIVSSIAALQAHKSGSAETAAAMAALRDRIRSISLVHEKLHGNASGSLLDMGDYVGDLVRRLVSGLAGGEGPELELELEHVPLPMDFCVDLGLVASELIANAFRHGLEGGRGRLVVTLRREGDGLLLAVGDDGPGYPEGFSSDSGDSLGFKIVRSLARKRHGSLILSSGGGARAELRLPMPAEGLPPSGP